MKHKYINDKIFVTRANAIYKQYNDEYVDLKTYLNKHIILILTIKMYYFIMNIYIVNF